MAVAGDANIPLARAVVVASRRPLCSCFLSFRSCISCSRVIPNVHQFERKHETTMTKNLCHFARTVLTAAVASLPLLCGCRPGTATPPSPKSEPPLEVKAIHPFRGEITRSVTLPGEIKPYQQATLYAKVTGYLKTITLDKGDPVQEGALLAEIEVPELLADAARYKAEVEVADIDYRRVSEAQKKAPDLVVPLSVDAAKGRYEVAKANLERAATLLKFTKIIAPFSGVITRRMVDVGAFIPAATAGSPQNAAS